MTTTKVYIKTKCEYCNGQAYLPIGDIENEDAIYTRYLPCGSCQGTGLLPRWISLVEFIRLIDASDVMEPDYKALAEVEPMSQYADSRDAAGI